MNDWINGYVEWAWFCDHMFFLSYMSTALNILSLMWTSMFTIITILYACHNHITIICVWGCEGVCVRVCECAGVCLCKLCSKYSRSQLKHIIIMYSKMLKILHSNCKSLNILILPGCGHNSSDILTTTISSDLLVHLRSLIRRWKSCLPEMAFFLSICSFSFPGNKIIGLWS